MKKLTFITICLTILVTGCNLTTQGQGRFGNERLDGVSGKIGWFGQRTKVDLGLRF